MGFTLHSGHCVGFIEAIVDTGSAFSVISTTDALRLQMPLTSMKSGRTIELAGYTFYNHSLGSVNLKNIKLEDNTHIAIDNFKMGVLIPTKLDKGTLNAVKAIPSIIGSDFLEDQQYALVFAPSKKTAYLDKL
jgi:hypothetical protein